MSNFLPSEKQRHFLDALYEMHDADSVSKKIKLLRTKLGDPQIHASTKNHDDSFSSVACCDDTMLKLLGSLYLDQEFPSVEDELC